MDDISFVRCTRRVPAGRFELLTKGSRKFLPVDLCDQRTGIYSKLSAERLGTWIFV